MIEVDPKVGIGKGKLVNHLDFIDFRQPIIKSKGENLPHWEQSGKLQFITVRLCDSLPASKIEYLEDLKLKLINDECIIQVDDKDTYIEKIDNWLSKGYGECLLKYDTIQKLIDDALNYYDGKKYDLFNYVIMPNHIHIIVIPYVNFEITWADFKRYTTRKINKFLDRTGELWQRECFDRMIRSGSELMRIIEYIRTNPQSVL